MSWHSFRREPSQCNLELTRISLDQLPQAEQAVLEGWELGEYEDPDTGEVRHSISDHLIEQSQDLLDEAELWDEHLGGYADAVTYTLASTLRDHLNEPATTAS
jgi:hypothetical protein